jgi:glycerophosphoryl diester phosphodiesterase
MPAETAEIVKVNGIMRKRWSFAAGGLLLAGALITLNNSSLLASRPRQDPTLLAHRGIAQRYDAADMGNDTCTATRIVAPVHGYLENTIASMRAAFDAGADIVEFDIHPTTDGAFAIFHDWTLDCRTEGRGVTRDQAMADLRKLDIGYGYTADGGRTFPFRGRGVGLMPSLDEVLATFPDRGFLINIKSDDPAEADKLAAVLGPLSAERRARLMAYGGDRPIARLSSLVGDVRTMSRASLKACLVPYLLLGWSGHVPAACRNTLLLIPVNIAPWLWGWPNRFLNRMDEAGTRVFVLGPYHGGDFSTGLNTTKDFARLPATYSGGIMTDEIEAIAGAVRARPR